MEEAVAELFAVREKEIKRLESLNNLAAQETEIITQYHAGYEAVLKSLKEHGADYALLKAKMTVLNTQYRKLFELDKTHFYSTFKTGYPLVCLALMANEQLRGFIGYDSQRLYEDVIKEITEKVTNKVSMDCISLDEIKDRIEKEDKHHPILIKNEKQLDEFKKKCQLISELKTQFSELKTQSKSTIKVAVPHIKKFSGKTDLYWKDIEPRDKQFMIIKMEKGNKLRNSGASGEEFSADDINGKFIFTDGIDYMSNSDSDELIYMEV